MLSDSTVPISLQLLKNLSEKTPENVPLHTTHYRQQSLVRYLCLQFVVAGGIDIYYKNESCFQSINIPNMTTPNVITHFQGVLYMAV